MKRDEGLLPAVVVLGGTGGLGSRLVDRWLYDQPVHGRMPVVRVGSKPPPGPQPAHPWLVDLSWDVCDGPLSTSSLWKAFTGELGLYPRLVINSIGVNQIVPTEQVPFEDLLYLTQVNVWPTIALAQGLVGAPTAYAPGVEKSTLVSIGSNACEGAGAHSLCYVASKHALTGVTRSLARDFKGRINVLQINPPKIEDDESVMSRLIDGRNAELRSISLEEEKARQAASSPSGLGYPSSQTVAGWIYDLLRDFKRHGYLHGTIARIGYGT